MSSVRQKGPIPPCTTIQRKQPNFPDNPTINEPAVVDIIMDDSDDDVMFLAQTLHEQQLRRNQLVNRLIAVTVSASKLNMSYASSYMSESKHNGRAIGSRTKQRGYSTWVKDYLTEYSVYSPRDFRRRFRVPRALFARLHSDLVKYNPRIWTQRRNAAGKLGACGEVKILACLRFLGTGRATDDIDDSARMSEESLRQYIKLFCDDIIALYSDIFLSKPNSNELQQIADDYETKGFPGCIGAIDCCSLK